MANKKKNSNGRAHHQGPAEVVNPQIEQLCVEFYEKRDNEAMVKVLDALSSAQVLVPVQTKRIGNVVMMAPMVGTNPNGDRLIQVFTSRAMVPPHLQTMDIRSWAFDKICEIAGEEKNNILAIVVNPGAHQIPVPSVTARRIAQGLPLTKEKVANDEAEELLDSLLEQGDSEKLNSLINALLRARILVLYREMEQEQAEKVQLKPGERVIVPIFTKTDAGKWFLHIFTSDEKAQGLPQNIIPRPVPFIEAVKLANRQHEKMPEMEGIMINPGKGRSVVLNIQLLKTIEEQYQNLSDGDAFQLPKPAKAAMGPTDNTDVEAAMDVCRQNQGSLDATRDLVQLLLGKRLFSPGMIQKEEGTEDVNRRRISLKVYTTQKKTAVLHAYTASDKFPENTPASEILVMNFTDIVATAAKIAGDREDFEGIVVNPGPSGLVIPKRIVQAIDEQKEAIAKGEPFVMPQPAAKPVQPNEKQAQEQLKHMIERLPEEQQPAMEKLLFASAFLPTTLYEDGEEFIRKVIGQKEEYIDSLFEDCYSNKRMYPYLPEDFSLMALSLHNKDVIRLDLPETETHLPGEYIRVYIIWDNESKHGWYYGISRQRNGLKILEVVSGTPKPVDHGDAPVEGQELQYVLGLSEKAAEDASAPSDPEGDAQ